VRNLMRRCKVDRTCHDGHGTWVADGSDESFVVSLDMYVCGAWEHLDTTDVVCCW